jgi:hypothetical protein
MFWCEDMSDPYIFLEERHHPGRSGRERFVRNPGGDWVNFGDLPEVTRKALLEPDERKLVIPYGTSPTGPDDNINKPPVAEHDAPVCVPEN